MLPESFEDRRVTIMGLGRFGGGVAVARYLDSLGARLSITDLRTADQLSDSISQLANLQGQPSWFLGAHPDEAFRECEILVVNPAVRPGNELVKSCLERDTLITSEVELFAAHNPAFTIGVTGSNGKSTTCKLIHDLLSSQGADSRRAWLGGNIGCSLLPHLSEIRSDDVVVLELSSFQLHQLRGTRFRPDVAVVTGLTSNHLDWHPDFAHYRSSKQVVSAHLRPEDGLVLPSDIDWPVTGKCLRFGLTDSGEDGVFYEDGALIVRIGDDEVAEHLPVGNTLRGRHNLQNLAAAVAAVRWTLGKMPEVRSVTRTFRGLPHRMEVVGRAGQRVFVDDSSSTTPDSTMAALQSVSCGCVLIAGGGDKGINLQDMAECIAGHVRGLIAIGQTSPELAKMVEQERGSRVVPVVRAEDFDSAFRAAVDLSQAGDMVLLSPGCSSHDWFSDFQQRGESFTRLARAWCETREDDA